MQVGLELYDKLKAAADSAGLSIGRQMELLISQGLSTSSQDVAQKTAGAAVEAAMKQARRDKEHNIVELFGGIDGFYWGVNSAELLNISAAEAALESGWTGNDDIPDDFERLFLDKIKAGQERLVRDWVDQAKLGIALERMSKGDVPGLIADAVAGLMRHPGAREKLARSFERRHGRKPSDGGDRDV